MVKSHWVFWVYFERRGKNRTWNRLDVRSERQACGRPQGFGLSPEDTTSRGCAAGVLWWSRGRAGGAGSGFRRRCRLYAQAENEPRQRGIPRCPPGSHQLSDDTRGGQSRRQEGERRAGSTAWVQPPSRHSGEEQQQRRVGRGSRWDRGPGGCSDLEATKVGSEDFTIARSLATLTRTGGVVGVRV